MGKHSIFVVRFEDCLLDGTEYMNIRCLLGKEIAEKLNSFFINIGPKLANELDHVGKPDFTSYLNINKPKSVFKFTPIEEEETKTIIKKI